MIGAVAAIFFVGQFVEGNVLSPNLVGQSVGLHPVWLIFALSAFGSLFGFVGMLVAVPVAAVIGVVVRFFAERYQEGQLYKGVTADRRPAVFEDTPDPTTGTDRLTWPGSLPSTCPHARGPGPRRFLRLATATARRWPRSTAGATGPGASWCWSARTGAGKSHLAQVWAELAGRRGDRRARRSPALDPATLAGRNVALEDADTLAGDPAREEALFHLHNLVLAEGGHLLVTARDAPGALGARRCRTSTAGWQARGWCAIEPPDDALLAAVMVKLFADRQIDVRRAW